MPPQWGYWKKSPIAPHLPGGVSSIAVRSGNYTMTVTVAPLLMVRVP